MMKDEEREIEKKTEEKSVRGKKEEIKIKTRSRIQFIRHRKGSECVRIKILKGEGKERIRGGQQQQKVWLEGRGCHISESMSKRKRKKRGENVLRETDVFISTHY